jgi:hypothetical protein
MPKKSARRSKRRVSSQSASRKSPKAIMCRKKLSAKIGININEYKEGRYSSPAQAVAVSYSQVKKKYPDCAKYLKKSVRKSRKNKK